MTPPGARVRATAVARVDAIASAVVARAVPARFGVAVTPEEMEAVYRLRYRVVVAQGWALPAALPHGLERDADDAGAVQVVGWDGGHPVATARLVLPAGGRRLPTEVAFDLDLPGRERLVDVGRACVTPAGREASHRLFWGLLGQVWLEMRRLGYEESCVAVEPELARAYARWGLSVVALGPPRSHWGAPRYPARISPARSPARLARAVGPSLVAGEVPRGPAWALTDDAATRTLTG